MSLNNKIPLSKMSELSHSGFVLRHMCNENQVVSTTHIHKDNYYVFIFIESGEYRAAIDFTNFELIGPATTFIQPSQVHSHIDYSNVEGWILAIDPLLINQSYLDALEHTTNVNRIKQLSDTAKQEIKTCLSLLNIKQLEKQSHHQQTLVQSLIASYIGLFTSHNIDDINYTRKDRASLMYKEFKTLVSENYKTMKSPRQYAELLHLSPSYLNEIIKKSSGISVSQFIQNEVILQAKRLLFHTNLSIKEIAIELGYADYAYFTRLFSHITEITPTQFRLKHRK